MHKVELYRDPNVARYAARVTVPSGSEPPSSSALEITLVSEKIVIVRQASICGKIRCSLLYYANLSCTRQVVPWSQILDNIHAIYIGFTPESQTSLGYGRVLHWVAWLVWACWRNDNNQKRIAIRTRLDARRRCSKTMLVRADLYISCSCVAVGQSPNAFTAFAPFFSTPISTYNSTACLKASRNELHRDLYQKEFSAQRRISRSRMENEKERRHKRFQKLNKKKWTDQ